MRSRFFGVFWLVGLCSVIGIRAHTLPISFLTIVPDTEYLHLELTFNPFELAFASELDRNKNGRIDPQEWEEQQTLVTARILECLKLEVGGQPVKVEVTGVTPDLDSHHATLRAHYHIDARGQQVRLESNLARITSGSHLTQVTFGTGEEVQRAQLDMQSNVATFKPASLRNAITAPGVPVDSSSSRRVRILLAGLLGTVALATGISVARGWRAANRAGFRKSPSTVDL
jgi:hypothetical protein